MDQTRTHNPAKARYLAMQRWTWQVLNQKTPLLKMTADASDRQYYRTQLDNQSYVIMDADPNYNDNQRFCQIAQNFSEYGLTVPKIFKTNLQQGFLLLSDFGDHLVFDRINPANANAIYQQAIHNIVILQQQPSPPLPLLHYNKQLIEQDLQRFHDGYLSSHYNQPISHHHQQILNHLTTSLINNALEQPQVLTHKDFHCKNLFWLNQNEIGIIDFQDLLIAPLGYDMMSLLYDHYLLWPEDDIQRWIQYYAQQLVDAAIITTEQQPKLARWIDWLAILRILKNCGHFVLLDQKKKRYHYQQYLPNMFIYLQRICRRYPELHLFAAFLRLIEPKDQK